MNRKQSIMHKTLLYPFVIGCLLIPCCFGFAYGQSTPQPNIIFILTDDQRWDALGFAGNQVIQTPEMDQLARQGVYFRNAFVTTPICAASRASILTGLQERTHGYTFGQGPIDTAYMNVSYPVLMKGSGYYTGFFGKFGVEYHEKEALFDESEFYERNNQYQDKRGYFYKTIRGDTVHLTRYTGQKALDFISHAPAGQPFCLSLSFNAPHAHDPAEEQYFWQAEVDSLYRDQPIAAPPLAEDRYFEAQPDYVKQGFNRTRWYWRFDTPEKYQHSVKGYYRMISGIDLEIGKIRKLLEEKGLAQNTVIILMGDNGYFLGERQLAGKWLMYENSLRVPLILYDPRHPNPRTVEDLVLNIDIPPTLFALAGLALPDAWQGISLADYPTGKDPAKEREFFLCEHLWNHEQIPPSEGIRSKQWKYFRYRHDQAHEELYDLEKDPGEVHNLAHEPAFRTVLKTLRLQCDQTIKALSPSRQTKK